MPTNLEFKASIRSVEDIKLILNKINAEYIETIKQVDTYFLTQTGRLKIREINNLINQLIFYERPEIYQFRLSEYQIYEISDVQKLKEILTKSLGIRGVVKKTRDVYIYKNCRIHIDDVVDLGKFVEFEYMKELNDEKSLEVVNYLFGLISSYIVKIYRKSYIDLV